MRDRDVKHKTDLNDVVRNAFEFKALPSADKIMHESQVWMHVRATEKDISDFKESHTEKGVKIYNRCFQLIKVKI